MTAGIGLDHPQSRLLSGPERADWQAAVAARSAAGGGLRALIRSHPRAAWLDAGFTLGAYLVAHPSLALQLDDPLLGAFHYLEFGLEEGRYCHPDHAEPALLQALYAAPAAPPMEALRHLLGAGHSPFDIALTEEELWALHGLPPALAARFDPVHYHAMARRLAALGAPQPPGPQGDALPSRLGLVQHFLTEGQFWQGSGGAVLPIHPDLRFDPAFCAATNGAETGGGYRHFLRHGAALGQAGDAVQALAQATAGPVDPRCVAAIMAALPAYASAAGIAPTPKTALAHLAGSPDAAGFSALLAAIAGPFAAGARAILSRLACRPQLAAPQAAPLCWALLASGGEDPFVLARLASIAAAQGRRDEAAALRARVLAAHGGDVAQDPWAALALAEAWANSARLVEAEDLLVALQGPAQGDVALESRRLAAARQLFDKVWGGLSAACAAYGVAGVRALLQRVLTALTPPMADAPALARPIRRIALIGAEDIPQCHRYRLQHKAAHLRAAGYVVQRFDMAEAEGAFLSALPDVDAVIVCRLPATPPVIAAITTARSYGILTFYDIDDPLYDAGIFPPDLLTYNGNITKEQHDAMACGTVLFEHCAGLCDFVLAPTKAISRSLSALVRRGQVFDYPNALGPELLPALTRPPRPRGIA